MTDWDNMIAIDGERGIGKSTLALHYAFALDPEFPISHVYYKSENWKKTINTIKKGEVFVFDEGTSIAMNREWGRPEQIQLMKLLNVCRQINATLIWCSPNVMRLDKFLRDDILTVHNFVRARGLAQVYQRTWRMYVDDGELVRKSHWRERIRRLAYPSIDSVRPRFWGEYIRRKREAYQALRPSEPRPRTGSALDSRRADAEKALTSLVTRLVNEARHPQATDAPSS